MTCILWLFTPLFFWILSNISSLNLFVDRYFIPKETATIFLIAFLIYMLIKYIPTFRSSFPLMITILVGIFFIVANFKRSSFGLNKNTDYHHSLIINESYPKINQPITIEGDHKFFPNAYLNRNEYLFLVRDKDLQNKYKQFSKKINLSHN